MCWAHVVAILTRPATAALHVPAYCFQRRTRRRARRGTAAMHSSEAQKNMSFQSPVSQATTPPHPLLLLHLHSSSLCQTCTLQMYLIEEENTTLLPRPAACFAKHCGRWWGHLHPPTGGRWFANTKIENMSAPEIDHVESGSLKKAVKKKSFNDFQHRLQARANVKNNKYKDVYGLPRRLHLPS